MPERTVAILTIAKPGEMSKEQRKDVATWLREQAGKLVREGDNYSPRQYRARLHGS